MQKAKLLSFSNIYIFLWLVYNLQTFIFGGAGSLYSRIIVLFLLGTSLYYFAYTLIYYKMPSYMKGLSVLLIMFSFYGFLLILSPSTFKDQLGETVSKYRYIFNIYISLLPVYPFYVFTRQGKITEETLKKWVFVFFVCVTLQYYQNYQQRLLEALEMGSSREEFTNNFGYEFLSMIPLMAFFSKRKWIQYAGLVYAMVFMLMAMKRGAILIGAICIILFLFRSFRKATRKQKWRVFLLSLLLLAGGVITFVYLENNSDFFLYRVENTLEGGSSGRDVIFSTYFNYFISESNPLRFMFGHGAYTTLNFLGQFAHNDWLEIAISQGILGIGIYLLYWINFYKSTKKARFDEELFMAMSLLLISNFIRSFFSMSYGDMSIYATMCLGYCMGQLSLHEDQIKKTKTTL